MITKGELRFGDIVWTEFDPSVGHEYQDKRPAIVIQSNKQLAKSALVTVIPLTSNISNAIKDDILIGADDQNNLRSDSVAKVYCITSFDYRRFSKRIGNVNAKTVAVLKKYLKLHFDL